MKKLFSAISTLFMIGALAMPIKSVAAPKKKANDDSSISQSEFNDLIAQGVPANALSMALQGYEKAIKQGKVKNKRYLTVVDFNQPSTEKRLYVIDFSQNKVIYNEYVAHGKGSGGKKPSVFSSKSGSHASELGTILTANVYQGKHGESLRLNGIEPQNASIRSRAIVVHAADYATQDFIDSYQRLGRSWGCFAIDPEIAPEIIDTIKGGSVIYAYSTIKMTT